MSFEEGPEDPDEGNDVRDPKRKPKNLPTFEAAFSAAATSATAEVGSSRGMMMQRTIGFYLAAHDALLVAGKELIEVTQKHKDAESALLNQKAKLDSFVGPMIKQRAWVCGGRVVILEHTDYRDSSGVSVTVINIERTGGE